jgi:hypothetical protein
LLVDNVAELGHRRTDRTRYERVVLLDRRPAAGVAVVGERPCRCRGLFMWAGGPRSRPAGLPGEGGDGGLSQRTCRRSEPARAARSVSGTRPAERQRLAQHTGDGTSAKRCRPVVSRASRSVRASERGTRHADRQRVRAPGDPGGPAGRALTFGGAPGQWRRGRRSCVA